VRQVTGYSVASPDGVVGRIDDFILDDESWVIRYVVVDTRKYLPGGDVLVAPDWFVGFDWTNRMAHTTESRAKIKGCPGYDAHTPVNRAMEERLYDYYGRPRYWAR
jgi:hypothetical protein